MGGFMSQHTKCRPVGRARFFSLAIVFISTVTALATSLDPNPGIFAPNSQPYGTSYADWTTVWWQWAFSFPADRSPLLDDNGRFADLGQSGKVWFLCGIFGGSGSVERKITVPADKALLFPVYNAVWVNTPQYGDNPWSPEQEAYARGFVADAVNQLTSAACEID